MAVSIANHNPYSSVDTSTYTDTIQLLDNFDFSLNDQMEYGSSSIIEENNVERLNNSNNNICNSLESEIEGLVDQVINFVEVPGQQNSKPEYWSNDYSKSVMQGPVIVQVHTLSQESSSSPPNNPRKRRPDWDTLDPLSTGNSSSGGDVSETKRSVGNGRILNDRRKGASSGGGSRLTWTDDIEFEYGELTNNGLNNEAFLSLSSALTVLKQEIPSPTNDQQNATPKSPHEQKSSNHSAAQNINTSSAINSNITTNSSSIIKQNISQRTNNEQRGLNNESARNQAHLDLDECNSPGKSPSGRDIRHGNSEIQTDEQNKFQYVLAAATSIATKNNEDTLTYLNQGQSYEIKLKKLGDLSAYRGKILKSLIRICFHERRLQYMEKEQMHQWQSARPGERIVELDVPLSYGLCHISQPNNPNLLNTVEVFWDPMKEVGIYIKVNCISTEFTPKKHGGEKGVPFRIQVETYLENGTNHEGLLKPIHAAACQIKVFKLKGADRKHKQDREKIQKRPTTEQEKYQPSYECTILYDIPNDSITPQMCYSPEQSTVRPSVSPMTPKSPVHVQKQDSVIYTATNVPSPVGINSVSSSNSNMKIMDQNIMSPQQVDADDFVPTISKDSTSIQLAQWINYHRLGQHVSTFGQFSGADLLRMSKDDLIQICGLADGIRMYNTLHSKAITPKLIIYVSLDGTSYHAIYLHANTTKELAHKISKLPGFYEYLTSNGESQLVSSGWNLQSKFSVSGSNLYDATKITLFVNGPAGIHVLVTDEVLHNIKEDSLFTLEILHGSKVLMKAVYKNEI